MLLSFFDAANICSRSVESLRDVRDLVGVDSGWSALGMDACVERLVVVELVGLGLGSGKLWSLGLSDSGVHCASFNLLLSGELIQAGHELVVSDAASSLVLDFGKDQVDVSRSELLIEELAVLCNLGKRFTLHGSLFAAIVFEDAAKIHASS